MHKLSTINEAIEYISKLHANDYFYCLILHRNPATNVRTILGTVKCDRFKLKYVNNFDIIISLYDNDKIKSKTKPANTLQGNTGIFFSSVGYSKIEAKLEDNTKNKDIKDNKSYNTKNKDIKDNPKIVDLAIYGLRIINITDYSADFISSNGFDFSYVIKTPNSDMNLMTEWIFGRNVSSKALWINPDDNISVMDDIVFKKKSPKNRFLDI